LAIGTLCLLDTEPHALSAREVRLFEAMAADLMKTLAEHVAQWSAEPPIEPPAATVGQLVPMS
ncbi:MAG: hypothetical protein KKC85_20955, partial [Gammaproteobacteria bacterium]|nr:hypothetical protein [Gammaproteobacteria bacterium]